MKRAIFCRAVFVSNRTENNSGLQPALLNILSHHNTLLQNVSLNETQSLLGILHTYYCYYNMKAGASILGGNEAEIFIANSGGKTFFNIKIRNICSNECIHDSDF
jgi:hypothetical protein